MATQLFLVSSSAACSGIHLGTNNAKLDTATSGWTVATLNTVRGGGAGSQAVNTVTGPTNGVEAVSGSTPLEFMSLPLAADTTISGTITLNLWASENNKSANCAVNAIVQRIDSVGAIISTIAQTTRTTELTTTQAANNFTVTPTSTNMLKGDRIRVRVYFDDSVSATMATGFTATFAWNSTTAAVDGDSYITFNETFGFLTTEPAGTQLFLTSTAGPAVGANTELEMWTSRGASATTGVINTGTGWIAPSQWTATAGGTAIEWYSKPLTAFTLDGLVRLNIRNHESNAAATAGIRAELAVTAGDGSGAVVWAASCLIDTVTPGSAPGSAGTDGSGELAIAQAATRAWLAGDTLSVTDGQRLRLRLFLDNNAQVVMSSGFTATVTYDGPTPAASGDSWIQLPQSVTEYVASAPPVYPTVATRRAP